MDGNKIKLTQKEFDEFYEVEITEESEVPITAQSAKPQDTTPFLTEEEEEQDSILESTLEWGTEE